MTLNPDRSSNTAGLMPSAPSPWHLVDIDARLRALDHVALDTLLDEALASSLVDRDAECRYDDAWPADLRGCTAAGPDGLARLLAWQQARPQSAHAHLAEAHYWFHWAYQYRGDGWASSVSPAGWTCAHACSARAVLAALRALELDPTMWAAPLVILQSVAAFGEPEWLSELVQRGTRLPETVTDPVSADRGDAAGREVLDMLARCGLRPDEPWVLPTVRPAALAPPVHHKRMLKANNYWTHAILHVFPNAFCALRQSIWFMQPRWGGSHQKVLAFLASEDCAHLTAVERDRLAHEIWRDDHLGDTVDKDTDPDEAQAAFAATRQRAAESQWPYHRWETLRWLAVSHYMCDEHPQALACLREAEQNHPIDDDYAMGMAVHVAVEQQPGDPWLGQAIGRSAAGFHCTSALILRGYSLLNGKFGVPRDVATGQAWLQAAREHEPSSPAWDKAARALWRAGLIAEAHELLTLGLEAGGKWCSFTLGTFHQDGVHGDVNEDEAIRCFALAVEEGSENAAYKLGVIYQERFSACGDPVQAAPMIAKAAEWMHKAHTMNHDDALNQLLMYVGDTDGKLLRDDHLALVREHAARGNARAMASLSRLLAEKVNSDLHDYRESVRWMLGALAMAPDDQYVDNVLKSSHQSGLLSSLLYRLMRRRIKPHEIPGADNLLL